MFGVLNQCRYSRGDLSHVQNLFVVQLKQTEPVAFVQIHHATAVN